MASAIGRVGPIPKPAAAKACRLGEVEGLPEKRVGEADGGEAITRLIEARIPGGDDVGRQCPAARSRIGGEAGRSPPRPIEMKPARSLAAAPISRSPRLAPVSRADRARNCSTVIVSPIPADSGKVKARLAALALPRMSPRRLMVGIMRPYPEMSRSLCLASA
jgi:hypothetical protein